MSIESLLSKFDRVKQTGQGRWIACCPAHDDQTPSLSIRELSDGTILLHDFGHQCSAADIVAAVGMELHDLFPARELGHSRKPERRPFPATDILKAVGFEVMLVAMAAGRMLAGEVPSPGDRDRLYVAHQRLQAAIEAGGLNHD